MLSATLFDTSQSPGDFARGVEQALLRVHPNAPHEVSISPDDSEATFMCMNWSGDRQATLEFEVYRFQWHEQGVIVCKASLRPHCTKFTAEEFRDLRSRWVKEIQSANFPEAMLQAA